MIDDLLQHYVLDENNRPVEATVHEWALWYRDNPARSIVHQTAIGDIEVSTVFLAFNHRYFGDGPPLLFETMVFGGAFDLTQWRYASWDDAVTGHAVAVRKVREMVH